MDDNERMQKRNKKSARAALNRLHRIFATSGVTLKELLETSRRVRKELIKK